MSRDAIRDLLSAARFQPFRVHTSGGKQFDVRHPEFAMLSGSLLLIAADPADPDYSEVYRVSLLHITHTEPIKQEAA